MILICLRSVVEFPCQYIELTAKEKEVIAYYIIDGTKRNFFLNDMGVVMLKVENDKQGRKTWYLSIEIEDRYKELPPQKWTTWGTYMVLVNDKSDSLVLQDSAALEKRIKCLEEVIGSRLYGRSSNKIDRATVWPDFPLGNILLDQNGKPNIRRVGKQLLLGNSNNGLIIIFNNDGTIERQHPS